VIASIGTGNNGLLVRSIFAREKCGSHLLGLLIIEVPAGTSTIAVPVSSILPSTKAKCAIDCRGR
jgi:hypothetical protein